jgi:archaellum component FlaD/FlaE
MIDNDYSEDCASDEDTEMVDENKNNNRDPNDIEDIVSEGDDDLAYLEQMPPPQAATSGNPKVPGIKLGGLSQGPP